MVPEREAAFVQEMNGRWGVTVVGAGSAEQAVRDADVVITAGPIEDTRRATIIPEWLAPGSLTVTLDYDSYVTDAAIARLISCSPTTAGRSTMPGCMRVSLLASRASMRSWRTC